MFHILKYLFTGFLVLIGCELSSQELAVDYYSGDNYVKNLVSINGTIWCGGFLGLTSINELQPYDKELITDPFVDYKNNSWCFYIDVEKDKQGNLIVSDGNNLFKYNDFTLQPILTGEDYIYDFTIDENTIWTLKYGELIKINGTEIITYNSQNSSLPDFNYSCFFVKNDEVWLGTNNNGVVKFNGTESVNINVENSELPYNKISSIIIDQDNNVWLSCYTDGIYPSYYPDYTLVKITSDSLIKYNHANSELPVTNIIKLVSESKYIYLCTSSGLIIFDGRDWQIINKQNHNLTSDIVTSVLKDQNDFWIGTDMGISIVSDTSTTNLKIANASLSGSYEGPITEDKSGNIWIGTSGLDGNLNKFDGEVWNSLIQGNISNPQSFSSLAVDLNNVVWATNYSYSGGVYKIDGDAITFFNTDNSPGLVFPMQVVVDIHNNKWIISDWSLIKYNDTTWKEYTSADFEPLRLMHALATDSIGNIWIGVDQDGMIKYDGINWTHYDDTFFGNEYSEVFNIFIDDSDNVWFDYSHGTIDPKIGKFDGTKLTFYGEEIGLPEKLSGLLGVYDGNIYYSSSNGLAIYDWNKWTYYNTSNTRLLNDDIRGFFHDSKDNMWLSSLCYVGRLNLGTYYGLNEKFSRTQDKSFTLFPNPVNDKLSIHSKNKADYFLDICIYDLNGRQIFKKADFYIGHEYSQIIDMSSLQSGIYIVQFSNKNILEHYKFIKN